MRVSLISFLFIIAAPLLAAQHDSTQSSGDFFSLSSRYFNIYNEQTTFSRLKSDYTTHKATFGFSFFSFDLAGEIHTGRLNVFSENSDSKSLISLKQDINSLKLGLRSKFKSFYFKPEVEIIKSDSRNLTGYKLEYGFDNNTLPVFHADFSFSRTYVPFALRAEYSGEGFQLGNRNPYNILSTGLSITMLPGISHFDFKYKRNFQIEASYDSAFGYSDKPELEFLGLGYFHKGKEFRLNAAFSRIIGSHKLFLLSDILPFSIINLPTVSYSELNTNVEFPDHKNRPVILFNYYFLRLYGAGNIQAWPFTSVVTAIIANRLNFRIDGSINVFNFGGSAGFNFGIFTVRPELQIYHFVPQLEIDTWQPEYLVFGVKNYYENFDDIKYAGLGKVSGKIEFLLFDCTFTADVSQYVPFYSVKEARKPKPPGQVTSKKAVPSVSGGFDFMFTLKKIF